MWKGGEEGRPDESAVWEHLSPHPLMWAETWSLMPGTLLWS